MARLPNLKRTDAPRVEYDRAPAPTRSMADLPPSAGYLQGEIERLPVAGPILGDEEFPVLQGGQAKRGSTRSLLKRIREEANDVAESAAKIAVEGGGSGRHSLVRSFNRARPLASLDGSELVGIVREGEFFRVPASLLSGGGGGGDADTLEGHASAYFLDWGNFTGVPATFTPSAHTHPQSEVTGLVADLAAKAPLASPALTGNPTAPTQAAGNNSTRLATTAYTDAAIAALIASAPGVLDTLDEIAAALGDDPNFATTMTTALAGKLAKASNLSDLADAPAARANLGLGNVDNTSDATKNAAVASLTNKNLTSGTNTFPTFNQNTTGSAAKLTTARNIDGQAFDGTANITVIAPGTHAATSKTTPVDADELPLVDSAASNVLKKLTFSALKTWIKGWITKSDVGLGNVDNISIDGAWTPYTPTVSVNGATGASGSGVGAYKVLGKLVVFRQVLTVSAIGTGGTTIRGSLPHTVAAQMPCTGVYINNGKSLCSQVFSNYTFSLLYDGSFPFGDSSVLSISGFYEIA